VRIAVSRPRRCSPRTRPHRRQEAEHERPPVRRLFPKGTDPGAFTGQQVAQIDVELNQRPRKTLAWRTPPGLPDTLTPVVDCIAPAPPAAWLMS
jgi:IS30 family transposase